jgi:HK97 family phage major capsid protein
MPNIDVVLARLDEIETEFRTINTEVGDRSLNDDEQTRWEALEAEHAELRASADKMKADADRAALVAEQRARWGSLQVGTTVTTADDTDIRSLSRGEARDRAMKRMEVEARGLDLSADNQHRIEKIIGTRSDHLDGDLVARALLATERPAYKSAFGKAIAGQHGFTPDEARALDEARAASLTSGNGGYGVPVLIDPTIVLTAQESLSAVRQISTVIPVTTNVWKGVTSAGVTWSWDAEAAAVSDDAPTLVQPSITTYAARGFIPYSIEISQDYPSFAEEFGRLLSEGYDELRAAAYVTGSTPIGILTALDANTNVEVTPTTDGSFAAVDIDKVWTALPDRAKRNATWLMSSDVSSYIGIWGDAFGGQTVDLAGVPTTLRGRPIAIDSAMPSFTGTTGASNILIVGDFKRFYVIERMGMSVEPIQMLFDVTTNMPTGQRGIFAMARAGSDSIDDDRFRLLQNA